MTGARGGDGETAGGETEKVWPHLEQRTRAPRGPTFSSATRNRALHAEQATIMP